MEKSCDVTRVVYYLNDQETPYLTKLNIPSNEITLADFKNSLEINTKTGFKFFFKSQDAEVGIVKEEIIGDDAKLPLFKGRVVAWLVPCDGTNLSDKSNSHSNGLSTSNSISLMSNGHHANHQKYLMSSGIQNRNRNHMTSCDTSDCDTTETESVMSSKRDRRFNKNHSHHHHHSNSKSHFNHCCNDSIALTTSDIDSTTFVDTDDESYYRCSNRKYDDDDDYEDECDNMSQFSATSEETSISKVAQNRLKKKKRLLHLAKIQARANSVASGSNASDSLDVVEVILNLTKGSFLGISIFGQCYSNGDNSIYVGSIMENGVVQQDGRIDVGDMILQVNDVNFAHLTNDDAVAVLKKAVSKPGDIRLVVAKHNWLRSLDEFKQADRSNEDALNLKDQPCRPIDPIAWVEHTRQVNRSQATDTNPTEMDINNIQLSTNMEMLSIARAMSAPDSGLEIKDRTWLKITFSAAFLGSDLVSWLYTNVQGFKSRKDAKKFAVLMLKNSYIKHTLNKSSFSEQCYYTFSEKVVLIPSMDNLNLNEDPNDRTATELNYALENPNNPTKFLPWAQNTVSYGVFESTPSLQENGSNQKPSTNFQIPSIASSCSDQQSQASGPIHVSQFQFRGAPSGASSGAQATSNSQQQLFYTNQQQISNHIHHTPPFAPQPSTSNACNQASNFFSQFETNQNQLRAASSNSSETQSSLNTLSTRDTAIGIGSNNQITTNGHQISQQASTNQFHSNVNHHHANSTNSNLISGVQQQNQNPLTATNGLTNHHHQHHLSSGLTNLLQSNMNNDNHHLLQNGTFQHLTNMHLNSHTMIGNNGKNFVPN